MEIKWLGHACFSIKHKGYTVVIDPYNYKYTYGYPRLNLRADKVLVSHEHYGHNCREAVTLSGRPESQCPFAISSFSVDHDTVSGRMRGTSLVHILEADGLKLVHTGDIGTKPTGEQSGRLFGADVMMVCAGSCTALPAQEVWRLSEELMPKVIIPMHYRFKNYGTRRLEHIEALTDLFDSPELIHSYDTDTIRIDENTEPQIAILNYLG